MPNSSPAPGHATAPPTLLDPRLYASMDAELALATFGASAERERDVLEESIVAESRAYRDAEVAGPLCITFDGTPTRFADGALGALPPWVEPDCLTFERSEIDHVVAIEKCGPARMLVDAGFARSSERRLVVSLNGLPSLTTRRFLHRVSHELSLPVYLLADGDTWGYFLFSILRRGMVTPGRTSRRHATADVRFLGVRAMEVSDESARIAWKPEWDARLAVFRRDPIFSSASWQRELDLFESQHAKVELEGFLHSHQAIERLEQKIRTDDCLR